MPIILEHKIGNCTIQVNDDYVVKTKEEEQKIFENIARIYVRDQLKNLENTTVEGKY